MKRLVVAVILLNLGLVSKAVGRELSRSLPNDPQIAANYGLMDNGRGSDVKVRDAWRIATSCTKTLIAIIDTGIDQKHPDLQANLWRNSGESGVDKQGRRKERNGVDDDKNGFVDDVIGWDFVDNDNDPDDLHGHGTHVAGIIGAVGENGIGTSGVCSRAKMMILKYYSPSNSGKQNLKNSIDALRYAIKMRAKIINYSGGGSDASGDEEKLLKEAESKGMLVVAAAGNGHTNTDNRSYYPAAYKLNNIISVAATNPDGAIADTSNYGPKGVHIAAPGERIYSTLPGGKYGRMTGTSQATPFVTGAAALIWSKYPQLSIAEIKNRILNSIDPLSEKEQKMIHSGGKLNIYRALSNTSNPKSDHAVKSTDGKKEIKQQAKAKK